MPPWELPGRAKGERYLVVVRSADASDGDGGDQGGADPGLSVSGRAQAEGVAAALAPLGPLALVVAPLRRAEETAAPLARRWGTSVRVEPALAEPLPDEVDVSARRRLLDTVAALGGDAVVVVEVGALGVLIGASLKEGRAPDPVQGPGTHSTLRLGDGGIHLVRLGSPVPPNQDDDRAGS